MASRVITWLSNKGHYQGVFWITLVCLFNSINDTVTKLLCISLDAFEVVFLRSFFSTLFLLPFVILRKKAFLKKTNGSLHLLRVIIGYAAILLWSQGVSRSPLSLAGLLSQVLPLFIFLFSVLFLKEKLSLVRVLTLFTGFIGIIIIEFPAQGISLGHSQLATGQLCLILAIALFALSDIINKYISDMKENILVILFYFSMGSTIISYVPAYTIWQIPLLSELLLVVFLSIGANLIMYCLVRSFMAADITGLIPYRFLEVIFSTILGFVLFYEIPTLLFLVGAAIIIPSILILSYHENKIGAFEIIAKKINYFALSKSLSLRMMKLLKSILSCKYTRIVSFFKNRPLFLL